jgi:putative toxin-antitoxin system antitoxin component (TIGR02293 family)
MDYLEAARVLGLETSGKTVGSDVRYVDMVGKGLPVKTLERISDAYAPDDKSFRYRIVPKASLARCKQTRRLSPSHSAVVGRLASVWTEAARIWKSDDAARDFLNRPHMLLGGRKPLDLVFENEIGAELVKSLLGRLENGSAV